MSFSDLLFHPDDSLKQNYPDVIQAWSHDAKLLSLFAKIPPQLDSPTIKARIDFWQQVIWMALKECPTRIESSHCVLKVDQLELKFKRKGLVPLGLQVVLSTLLNQGLLMDSSMFLSLKPKPTTWTGWAVSTFITRPLSWGWTSSLPTIQKGNYVCLPLVQEWSDCIVQSIQSTAIYPTHYVMSFKEFQEHAQTHLKLQFTSQDIHILLHQLVLSQHVCIKEKTSDTCIIKFKSPYSSCLRIDDVDMGIVHLKQTIAKITRQIEVLKSSVTRCTMEAKQCVQDGQKEKAKYVLRKRKQTETQLTARLESLTTLETLLHKIQSSESDAQILQAYTIGADTLKNVLKRHDLSVDKIEKTMDKVQDVLLDQQEMEDALALGNEAIQNTTCTDEDLEQELNDLLLQQETEKENKVIQALEMEAPMVPMTSPDSPASNYTTPPQAYSHQELDSELDAMLAKEMQQQLKLDSKKKEEKILQLAL